MILLFGFVCAAIAHLGPFPASILAGIIDAQRGELFGIRVMAGRRLGLDLVPSVFADFADIVCPGRVSVQKWFLSKLNFYRDCVGEARNVD